MLPLNQLLELVKAVQAREALPVLDTTESPTFDTAWGIYTSMASKNPAFYSNIWSSAAAFALTDGTRTLDIPVIREASNFIAMGYISAAHYVLEIIQDTAPDQLQSELEKEISSKIKFIDYIASKMTLSLSAQLHDVRQKGGLNATLDVGMKHVLGEFYSLCIYAQRELRGNAYQSIKEEALDTIINHSHAIKDFGLPLFLNREDRKRQQELGDDVAVLAVRPALKGSVIEAGASGQVIQLGKRLKRVARDHS